MTATFADANNGLSISTYLSDLKVTKQKPRAVIMVQSDKAKGTLDLQNTMTIKTNSPRVVLSQ